MAAVPASAGVTFEYCGKTVSSGSWCRGGNGINTATADPHSYNYNAAYFNGGSPGIRVCEEAVPSGATGDSVSKYTYNCGTSYGGYDGRISSGYDLNFNCGSNPRAVIQVYVDQESGGSNQVYGYTKYGTGQGFPC